MLTYYHLWQMNPTKARRILVKDYQETGSYSQTAKNFATHRRIVRKWVLRYQEKGDSGLESLPPIPKSQPARLDPHLETLILRLRDSSGFGPKAPPLLAEEEPPNRDCHLYYPGHRF